MAAETAPCRLAVDIGGTFTDVVLEKDGVQTTVKVLTTPQNPADGFMNGLRDVLGRTGTDPADLTLIIHGTTLATNALIERKGARTALIATDGHRDTLEIAYENRFDQYDINADRLKPLVPRELRLTVPERLNFRGEVLDPIQDADIATLIPQLREAGVESVAIGLLHAYANPAHEDRIAAVLRKELPDLSISLSSQVCPEIREYERQTTTCANAYVRPIMESYLHDVQGRLVAEGVVCPCLLMTSGGNLITIETAKQYPVRLIESGPAGGAILAGFIAQNLGEYRVLSFYMGGTTAKICLIDNGEPLLSRTFEIDRAHRFMKGSGMPVKIPVVEMVEIGAGGGSIAHVDALGRIQVGPESAGADPGPACYGRGGTGAAITDANLLMGRLDPEGFAGGRMTLDTAAAAAAMTASVGAHLDRGPVEAAKAVIEIVDENMASAARVHAVERGAEIAGRTMIAFGGGAPLHALRLAQKLGISKVVVPANAGVGSAIGFLMAPVAYELVRSHYVRVDGLDATTLNGLFAEMFEEAAEVVRLGSPETSLEQKRHAYARYVGQGHEVKIELPAREFVFSDGDSIREAFEQEYRRQYGRIVPGLAIEVLTWSIMVSEKRAVTPDRFKATANSTQAEQQRTRDVHFSGQEDAVETKILGRENLPREGQISGPAIITEIQTSTVVPEGFAATTNAYGDLVLERTGATTMTAAVAHDVRNQVLWDRIIAVVEEQAQAIIRTSFSTSVREAGDLSAGVYDLKGRMLAQAVTGTPGHVNAMAASVGFFLEKYPIDTMNEGDVFVTNDPWLGTGHLFDFTVVNPVFKNGRIAALFASTSHVVDVGGRGFGPDAGQVYEEGLNIPIMPLFSKGVRNDSVFSIVEANVREPVQVVGDLYSLSSSNELGGRRLIELMDEFHMDNLEEIGEHIIDTSRNAMLDEIRALPAGVYENQMTVDGYEKPVTLKARMTIGNEGISVDYEGTSSVSQFGINVPLTYCEAYTSFGIRCIVGSAVPNNTGSLEPIRTSAPVGTIVNAPPPCAVTTRHVIGQMLPDVVLGCLEKAIPGQVPAEGSSSLWNPMLSGGHGFVEAEDGKPTEAFSVTIFHSGGTGARPTRPGLSATAFPSGVRNTPVEITESIAPLIFRRKEFRVDSGGRGLHRGGDGQTIEIEHADKVPFAVFALFDRIDNPARGRQGGESGAAGRVRLASGAPFRGKGKQIVNAGDRLILDLPGGGGFGKSGS